jgi:6-pyruvoyltetrahydropterin/6-carboxytetrahydropterin synthase
MIFVTRKMHFNAAHRVYQPNWSEEQNQACFGKCANANWHGHNYDLFVTVKGEINPDTGFVVDLNWMKKIIEEHIIDVLDHKNLNLDVPFMKNKMASTEVLAVEIYNILQPLLAGSTYSLHGIKLVETERNFVEYFGN